MNKYRIDDDVYGSHFELIVNCSKKQFDNYTDKQTNTHTSCKNDNDNGATFLSIKIGDDDGNVIGTRNFLWIESFNWILKDLGVLCHEITHMCHGRLYAIGLPLADNNTEAYAYYITYIFNKCVLALDKLRKCTKTSRKKKPSRG